MKIKFKEDAQKIWDSIKEDMQIKILKSVFCTKCLKAVEIVDYKGSVEDGLLILNGKCKTCSKKVTRVVD